MRPSPILTVKGLTKTFGRGCPQCLTVTGPERETNVCCNCGSIVACAGVSVEVYPGEIVGIVGESGSGKSTIVRILHFDMDPDAGEMYFNLRGTTLKANAKEGAIRPATLNQMPLMEGKNLFGLSSYQKRQIRNGYMGIVYQHPPLGLRMDVSSGGNVAEKLVMAHWRSIAQIRQRASSLLKKMEVPSERMDEPPKNFSGGMQQRVQIAKALSNQPLILLLDEVTSGLDVSVQARVLDLIRNLQQELHLAMLVISHDLGVIRLLSQRTMVMKFGRVVEAGLTDQVLEDPQHSYTQMLVSSQL